MNFDFDLTKVEGKCFISDEEWNMILMSKSYRKIGKCYYAVYKNHILTFIIRNNNVELLDKRKKPCRNYELPTNIISMNFSQRLAAYQEEMRLVRGEELDDSNFIKYAKIC